MIACGKKRMNGSEVEGLYQRTTSAVPSASEFERVRLPAVPAASPQIAKHEHRE
jgi:hypothetical protein